MGQEHIRDISHTEPCRLQGIGETEIALQLIMTKEFCVLFIPNTRINQDESFPVFYQDAAKSPGAKIICIRRIRLIPDRLGHYAKHGAPVKLKETSIDAVEIHV